MEAFSSVDRLLVITTSTSLTRNVDYEIFRNFCTKHEGGHEMNRQRICELLLKFGCTRSQTRVRY